MKGQGDTGYFPPRMQHTASFKEHILKIAISGIPWMSPLQTRGKNLVIVFKFSNKIQYLHIVGLAGGLTLLCNEKKTQFV